MMTARQVAEVLGVHENWVYDQAASGFLPSYKIGGTRRFLRDELQRWIAKHRQPAREPTPRTRVPPAAPRRPRKTAVDPQPSVFAE
jgi:excisionase family DNA binding protein